MTILNYVFYLTLFQRLYLKILCWYNYRLIIYLFPVKRNIMIRTCYCWVATWIEGWAFCLKKRCIVHVWRSGTYTNYAPLHYFWHVILWGRLMMALVSLFHSRKSFLCFLNTNFQYIIINCIALLMSMSLD